MAQFPLKPGHVLELVDPAGARRKLKVTGLALAGPHEIKWQQAGKPPRLRSVIIEFEDVETGQ